jgi:hypothetical protein
VKRMRPGLSDATSLDERSWLDKADASLSRSLDGAAHMIRKADHDLTGWFAQSLRLKSKLHLVKGIDRCEVAFGTFRQWSRLTGCASFRPFRLAFAGVENRRDWVASASLRNSSATGRQSPDGRPVSGRPRPADLADRSTTPALRRDTCRMICSSHKSARLLKSRNEGSCR